MKPLILSTRDVQSIIAGRKLRHSLPVKPQPWSCETYGGAGFAWSPKGPGSSSYKWNTNMISLANHMAEHSPFGSPGDQEWQTGIPPTTDYYWVEGEDAPKLLIPKSFSRRWKRMGTVLYGREAWRLRGWDFEEGTMLVEYATGEKKNCPVHDPSEDSEWLMDQVDYMIYKGYIITDPKGNERYVFTDKKQPFNSPLSMPREAARIFLEVTGVTCQRVQDITPYQVLQEGIGETYRSGAKSMTSAGSDYRHWEAKQSTRYVDYWIKKHGPDSWNNNEWVFSANWKVLSTTGKPGYL